MLALNAIGATISFNFAVSQFGELGGEKTASCIGRIAVEGFSGTGLRLGWYFIGLSTLSLILASVPSILSILNENLIVKSCIRAIVTLQMILVFITVFFSLVLLYSITKVMEHYLRPDMVEASLNISQAECNRLQKSNLSSP